MAKTKAGGWIAGTIVLVIAMTAAAWFFIAEPRFSDAGDTVVQAQNVRDQNDLLQQKIAKLKADFAHLDDYRAQVADLRKQVPATALLTDYTRAVQEVADSSGVTLLDMAPGTAVTVTVPAAAVPVPTATEDPTTGGAGATATASPDAASSDATSQGAPAAAEPASTVPDGMVAVPTSLRVLGTYDQVRNFLGTLQTGVDRLFLVTALDGSAQERSDGTAARPATQAGDLELSITGYLWVLPETPATGTSTDNATEGSTDEPPAELPQGTRNPFSPLG